MEKQDKHSTDQLRGESVKWACDVLDLDPQVFEDSQTNASRQSVGAFFESLKSNGFYVDSHEAEAVELILGNPTTHAPQFLKHLNQQGFQTLDDVAEWFANELGVMHGPSLLNALKERLANLNLEGCSEGVHNYAQRIWQAGLAVDRKVLDPNSAVTKILQALFQIATVRQSQRCRIRSQWVKKLRNEFSVDELGAAKQIVQRTAVTPGGRFHRPFLFMLTRKVVDLDKRWLPPPVDSRRSATTVQKRIYSEPSTDGSRGGAFLGWMLLLAVCFGTISSCVSNMNSSDSTLKPNSTWKPNSNWRQNRTPVIPKVTIDPNDKKMMEALGVLLGEGKVQELRESHEQVEELRKIKPELFDLELYLELNQENNPDSFLKDIPKMESEIEQSRRLRGDQ